MTSRKPYSDQSAKFSGKYADLTGRPIIPSAISTSPTFNAVTVGDAGGLEGPNDPTIKINHLPTNSNTSVPIVSLKGELEGTSGGQFVVKTATAAGTLTERLRINNLGAVGFGGSSSPNTAFGVAGQVLTSSHDGAPPVWKDKTRIVRFKGTGFWAPDGTGANAGSVYIVKWPGNSSATGWLSSKPDNTFCEEYGVSGSSNSSGADGSIKILEAGEYLIHVKYVIYLHGLGYSCLCRLWKIPASNGANDFSNYVDIGSAYLTTNPNDGLDDIHTMVLTHTELVELTVGERLILSVTGHASKFSLIHNTQIIIQKVNDDF